MALHDVTLNHLDILTPDGSCDVSIAKPNGAEKFPAVIYLMDAFGVRPVIDDWIKRIAAEGYVVLAPNLFYRSKRSPIVEDVKSTLETGDRAKLFGSLMPMMQQLTAENLAKDEEAFVSYLLSLPEVIDGPMGVTGYCLGARVALQFGGIDPDRIAAIAGFHGGNIVTDKPDSPHLVAPKLKARVYIAFADHDESAPPEQQAELKKALDEAGLDNVVTVYEGAAHGYTMSDTPAYNHEAAERQFGELIGLLKRSLG